MTLYLKQYISEDIVICHPCDPCIGIENLDDFTTYLQDIGFISAVYTVGSDGEKRYEAGDRILDFIDPEKERELWSNYNDRFTEKDHFDVI
ncbi:MAG: hypothetical protein F6K16_30195 [Symploca sp. SIO2B6]|nr:hypothetical protein [Symploca sp. SIO2B6]